MPASPTRCAHLAALMSLACAAALAAARPTAPGPAARRRSIDVKHVALDLRFDWGLRRAQGTATITLAPLRAADRVTLDAGRLAIEAVSLAGGSPLAFTYDGGDRDDGLLIRLGRTVAAGEDVTLRIAYHSTWHNRSDPNSLGGSDGRGLRFFSPTGTEPMKRRQLWSQGLPAGNRFWFPGYDAPDDWRTTDLRLTVEPPLVALGNGTLVGTHDNPDGTRTFHWRADRPHANHLTSIVIGEYTVVRQAAAGVALESWGYPDEVAAVEATVERLPALLACLSEATGVPYPLPRYAQAFVQDLPWGAGNHGTSTLTENMIDDARTHADWRYLWDGLEAEALAAQWLGGLTTPRDWRDAWLTRGMAHYFDGLCNERLNGRTEFLLWQLAGDQATALGDWSAGIRRPVVPADPDSGRAWALDNGPWARGALVLHQLRAQLGDERFARAMRHFVATAAGRPVGTADFQRAMEASSGEGLDWFFDQWVYGIGHPVFEVTRTYDAARGRLTLRVRQAQAVDTASSFPRARWFRGWVEVEVDDRVERVWLAPREVNLLTFTAATEPRLVQFDVEGAWLKELTFRKPLEELLYQVAHDRDVLGLLLVVGADEGAARHQLDPHRLEVAGQHGLVVGLVGAELLVALADPAVGADGILLAPGERQGRDAADGFDAGQGGEGIAQLVDEGGPRLARQVLDEGERRGEGHGVAGVEAGLDALDRGEAAHHEAGADQQDQRQGELAHDEHGADLVAAGPADAGAAVAQGVGQVAADGAERRREPEEERGGHGRGGGKGEGAAVEGDLVDTRQVAGAQRLDQPDAHPREPEAEHRAAGGEDQALGEHLGHDASPAAPDRRAHGDLAAAFRRPHQQQVGDVGARDQQDEPHRAEQGEQRGPRVLDHVVVHAGHRDLELLGGVELVGLAQARGQAVHVGLGLGKGDALLEPGHDGEPGRFPLEVADVARQHAPGVDVGRHGGVGGEVDAEVAGEHPDDLRAPAVHLDRAAEDRGIPAEAALPQPVADHHLARRQVGIRAAEHLGIDGERVLGGVITAEDRLDPEEREQVGGDVGVGDPFRRPLAGDGPRERHGAREARELGGLGLVVLEVGPRDQRAGHVGGGEAGPDECQLAWVVEGQVAEQDRVRDAEDRDTAADPERQGEQDDPREEGPPGEGADGELHVLQHVADHEGFSASGEGSSGAPERAPGQGCGLRAPGAMAGVRRLGVWLARRPTASPSRAPRTGRWPSWCPRRSPTTCWWRSRRHCGAAP